MSDSRRCNRCGTEVRRDTWHHEICPVCLLEDGAISEPGSETPDSATERVPGPASDHALPNIKGYRFLRALGEGGMGVVYLAEQDEPVRRQVAVKVVKPGMDSTQVLARFETERQALALMSHPNIAKVYDAGMTERGLSYFSMEYFEGLPITEFCDRERLGTEERIRLFLQVCEGVTHAHQRGVIHRDIKPSNVLVAAEGDRRVPKLIDFGLAKAMGSRLVERTFFTEIGQVVGTPAYMSPEQADLANLDIDTRTDVYSLGVLLYELLAGALPFDPDEMRRLGFDEWRRRIREETPPAPSSRVSLAKDRANPVAQARRTDPGSLERALRRDLDWITMKALEKERNRRYSSPAEFAADLEHHLKHEPVFAGPPSGLYRMNRFVRRHRLGVLLAAAALLTVLGLATREWMHSNRLELEKNRARVEADTANNTLAFLVELFEAPDPFGSKREATVESVLAGGADRIRSELADQPVVQAKIMNTIGSVQRNLGLYDSSRGLLEEALRIRVRELGENHFDVAVSKLELGVLEQVTGGSKDVAVALYRDSLDTMERLGVANHAQKARLLDNLASATENMEDRRDLHRRAITMAEELDHPRKAYYMHDYANSFVATKEYANARELYHEVVETGLDAGLPLVVAMARHGIANTYSGDGDCERGLPYYLQALEHFQSNLSPEHEYTEYATSTIGECLVSVGRYAEAIPYLEQGMANRAPAVAEFYKGKMWFLTPLQKAYQALGNDQADMETRRKMLAIEEHGHEEAHEHVANALWLVAKLELKLNGASAATPYFDRAIEVREGLDDEPYWVPGWSSAKYALIGDLGESLRHLNHALELGLDPSTLADDEDLVNLHGHPEFEAILATVVRDADPQTGHVP